MALYYFHLHECGQALEDLEGVECASLDEALEIARANARDVMIGELRQGKLCFNWSISVADASAQEVARLRFRDAVTIT
ncbi:DUF6894 family protein [Sphingomonas jeddahensis]|uniref:DUF6894 domain-containing protein n=1 Tax=Sphingomonas jeddahensis TaxID=1915074 RepID=A0A1V2EWY7_9SPHN|nr:hypothetical protein [Sphingomonas jeddahensis]ONF97110.1 hypothetical protein SPHI_05470 [Sphingomonas jeddahensis]